MAKATEWGAAAILSISSYGAGAEALYGSDKITISSTNNATGIYGLADAAWEYVAGRYTKNNDNSKDYTSYIFAANAKYYNEYTTKVAIKASPDGSALDLENWLGAVSAYWVLESSPVFVRGGSGLFSFTSRDGSSSNSSRAVVVCGAGL
jgi:hypothetical protein